MTRRIMGTLKGDYQRRLAYRNPWNTGKAAYYKRLQKVLEPSRPST